jgi:hypothetical protein
MEMFLPFLKEAFQALRREFTKEHPAIRLEIRLTCLTGTVVLFSLGATLVHALIPWVREAAEKMFFEAFITSGILTVTLFCISVGFSLRLK